MKNIGTLLKIILWLRELYFINIWNKKIIYRLYDEQIFKLSSFFDIIDIDKTNIRFTKYKSGNAAKIKNNKLIFWWYESNLELIWYNLDFWDITICKLIFGKFSNSLFV